MRRRSRDAGSRAELPLTYVIDSSIEEQFARVSRSWSARQDPLVLMREMLSECARARAHALMLACLDKPRHKRTVSLERAAQRMHDVDLDSAWRAALRGDEGVLHDRLAPHVTAPPKRTPKGSPWRMSGWLSRRTQ